LARQDRGHRRHPAEQLIVSDPIPGWHVQPTTATDPGRRPIGDLISAAGGSYRTHVRSILAISAVVEGTLSLLTLPYLVGQVRAGLSLSTLGTSGSAAAELQGQFGDVGASITSGLVSIAPVVSYLLITLAVSALLVAAGDGTVRLEDALRRLRRQWRSVLAAVGLVLVLFAVLIWAGFAAGSALEVDSGSPTGQSGTHAAISFGLSLITILWACALVWLAVRWAVAAPSLVIERLGLVPALDRSTDLTRRRLRHVGLVLLTAWLLYGIAVAVAEVLALAVYLVIGGAGPVATIPAAAVYIVGRVVAAPLGPLISAHLYRGLRDAGPARPQAIGR